MDQPANTPESDDRFASGNWAGFYQQWGLQCRQRLALDFREGLITGGGADPGGEFSVRGTYNVHAGTCALSKLYPSHRVEYDGFAEGDGIWGRWVIRYQNSREDRGGFHIWPVGEGEGAHAEAHAENPTTIEQPAGA